jgi:hypothetical protein
MGNVYKGVFGEVKSLLLTRQTPTPTKKEVEAVTELVNKYYSLSGSER